MEWNVECSQSKFHLLILYFFDSNTHPSCDESISMSQPFHSSMTMVSVQHLTPRVRVHSPQHTTRHTMMALGRRGSSQGDVVSTQKAIVGQCLGALFCISLSCQGNAFATGLERMDTAPVAVDTSTREQSKVLRAAEEEFQNSEFLKTLKERSELHREERQRALRDTYCKRQAELGVGDCAGLRLIPGATKSGVQKTPEWITKILGE